MDTKCLLKDLYRILQRMDERLILSELEGLSPKAKLALKSLEQNFAIGISLKEAAAQVRMRPDSLCREIHRELVAHGIYVSIPDYLDTLKVKRAKELFCLDPLCECKEVAALVGLSVRHLERLVKRRTGMAPACFRKKVSL
jgi:transcriptional regulator GlxA family with amidase domain